MLAGCSFLRQVRPCPWGGWFCPEGGRGWRGILSNLPPGPYTLRGSPRQVFQDGELALRPEVGILAGSWWLSQLKRGRVTKSQKKSPLLLGLQHIRAPVFLPAHALGARLWEIFPRGQQVLRLLWCTGRGE